MPPTSSPSDDVLDGMLDDIFADAVEPVGEVVEPSPADEAADAPMAEPSGEVVEPSPPGDAMVDEGKGVSILLDDDPVDVEPPPDPHEAGRPPRDLKAEAKSIHHLLKQSGTKHVNLLMFLTPSGFGMVWIKRLAMIPSTWATSTRAALSSAIGLATLGLGANPKGFRNRARTKPLLHLCCVPLIRHMLSPRLLT